MGEGTARIQPYLAAKLGQSNDITPAARQGYSSTSRDTHAHSQGHGDTANCCLQEHNNAARQSSQLLV